MKKEVKNKIKTKNKTKNPNEFLRLMTTDERVASGDKQSVDLCEKCVS